MTSGDIQRVVCGTAIVTLTAACAGLGVCVRRLGGELKQTRTELRQTRAEVQTLRQQSKALDEEGRKLAEKMTTEITTKLTSYRQAVEKNGAGNSTAELLFALKQVADWAALNGQPGLYQTIENTRNAIKNSHQGPED